MTTPHADRDRSDRPWWPPAASFEYLIHTTEPAQVVDPFLDEPVPYILTDEPVGERVHGFPLDEGDPGTPLLPVAPEGVVLQCMRCPATLADTAGGVLWHHEDGSHTYWVHGAEPVDAIAAAAEAELERLREERDLWKARATIAQGKVARAAALADRIDKRRLEMCRACREPEFAARHAHDCGETRQQLVADIRAELAEPEATRP